MSRIKRETCFGNPDERILSGERANAKQIKFVNKISEKLLEDYEIKVYSDIVIKCVRDLGYDLNDSILKVGYEPNYSGERLFVITFSPNKNECSITRGKSFGAYGSQILSKTSYYKDYKRKSKFTKFIDKWYTEYLEALND